MRRFCRLIVSAAVASRARLLSTTTTSVSSEDVVVAALGEGDDDLEFNAQLFRQEQERANAKLKDAQQVRKQNQTKSWKCSGCGMVMPDATRSICSRCHRLRDDADTVVGPWRRSPLNWICDKCKEFNFNRHLRCRCCFDRPHVRYRDKDAAAVTGMIVVTMDATWCCRCGMVNDIDRGVPPGDNVCKSCGLTQRQLTVVCNSCASAQRTFRNTKCGECGDSLQGALLECRHDLWSCVCGNLNRPVHARCFRCRLPKTFPSAEVRDQVIAAWDLRTARSWLCLSCYGVNRSSHVIATGDLRRARKMVAGDHTCRTCGELWHGALVDNDTRWRCHCGAKNEKEVDTCAACGILRDIVHVNKLSQWRAGDWVCRLCMEAWHAKRNVCGACHNPKHICVRSDASVK